MAARKTTAHHKTSEAVTAAASAGTDDKALSTAAEAEPAPADPAPANDYRIANPDVGRIDALERTVAVLRADLAFLRQLHRWPPSPTE